MSWEDKIRDEIDTILISRDPVKAFAKGIFEQRYAIQDLIKREMWSLAEDVIVEVQNFPDFMVFESAMNKELKKRNIKEG